MRRTVIPVLAVVLTLAGCTSGSTTKRTVTVINTVSGPASTSVAPKTGGLIVVSPSVAAPPTTVKTTPKPKPAVTTTSAAPIVKVDPSKADCATILDAADIKKAIGVTVNGNNNRVRLGAADHGVTGAVRCLYGSTDGGKTAPVRIRLTQYNSVAAAKKQVGVDLQAAQDAGAATSAPTVNGYPATLQLIAGGVAEMAYDTWTLSVAVSDRLASSALLRTGLPTLAGQALTRVIKSN